MMDHPEIDFMEEAFDTVMLKRELMRDVELFDRMKHFESRYERYENWMRQLYGRHGHEDDWTMFDPTYDYL